LPVFLNKRETRKVSIAGGIAAVIPGAGEALVIGVGIVNALLEDDKCLGMFDPTAGPTVGFPHSC